MVSSGWARPINYKPTSCQAIYFYFYIAYGILYDITAGGAYGLEGLNMVPSYNSWQVISLREDRRTLESVHRQHNNERKV
jgi:hypothetical protein